LLLILVCFRIALKKLNFTTFKKGKILRAVVEMPLENWSELKEFVDFVLPRNSWQYKQWVLLQSSVEAGVKKSESAAGMESDFEYPKNLNWRKISCKESPYRENVLVQVAKKQDSTPGSPDFIFKSGAADEFDWSQVAWCRLIF